MELLEFLKTENLAFRRKLQSKSEALQIIQSQLVCCQQELEYLRRSSKDGQPKLKNSSNKIITDSIYRNVENVGQTRDGYYKNTENIERLRLSNAEAANKKLADENKLLLFDIEDLKQKLNDANNDIVVLRRQQTQMRNSNPVLEKTTTPSCTQHLEQLEHLNRRYCQLEQDLHILLDEKQDLIKQRGIYYDKMQRLNIQIKNLLNISNQNVDFDAIMMENKYLKQRVEDLQGEKKMWSKTVSKYKHMLSSNCQNTGKILSYDQIARHINSMTSSISPGKQSDQNNLRQICITLLETLNEKNLLLQHQRKTNKILASRILELENQNGKSVNTCDVLLRGYSATGVYSEIDLDENEKHIDRRTSETSESTQESIGKDGNERKENEQIMGQRSEENRNLEHVQEHSTKVKNERNIVESSNTNDLKENVKIDVNTTPLSKALINGRREIDKQSDRFVEINNDKLGIPMYMKQVESVPGLKDDTIKDRGEFFDNHDDIQGLPVELQKLVLQAMKDLENDDSKSS